ncbi:MAG: hypothetical protein AAGA03_07725 [Planctomycetota bacterium]
MSADVPFKTTAAIDPATGLPSDRSAQGSLDTCQAVLIGLDSGRFVVVRREGPRDLWPLTPLCKRVRDLTFGDQVMYKGKRYTVRAVVVYQS